MAIPLALIALLASAAGAALSANQSEKNRKAQAKQNSQNLFEEARRQGQQTEQEHKNWMLQNQYNSPEQQMQRLRQAGLNPNLVYGKGADATADAIKTQNYSDVNNVAPYSDADFSGLSQGFSQMYDMKAKQAQTDNLAEQTALLQEEKLFKQANTARILQDTARSKFDLEQAQALKDSVIDNANLTNEKLRADTIYTLDSNQRQAVQHTSNVKKTIEDILTQKMARAKTETEIEMLKENLRILRENQSTRDYEARLIQMGISPKDPWYVRAYMNMLNGSLDPYQRIKESAQGYYDRYSGPSGVPKFNPRLAGANNKRK